MVVLSGWLFLAIAQPPAVNTIAPFPRTYPLTNGGYVTLYEPQVSSWLQQTHLIAWAAVAYAAKDSLKPVMGTIKIEADTEVALEERLVRFKDFSIPEVKFASLSRDDSRMVTGALQAALPTSDRVLSLDKVFAAVEKSQLTPDADQRSKFRHDPPAIFYSTTPAILIGFDNEPIWSPIKDTDLKFAVNTNWDVFLHVPTKTYYLRNDTNWYKSTDLAGGWVPAGTLPGSFSKLPADDNWKDVRAKIPGKPSTTATMPKIFVSNSPAELIVTTGLPVYKPVGKTSLFWVSNTDSDVFRMGKNGPLYYLVSGRWFSAPNRNGPWTFATRDLPADFRNIPLDHPRSRVLASVPGTPQANEAVIQSKVPTSGRVSKSQLKAPDVAYQGEPHFEPITDTMLSRAVNTDKQIIKYGDTFYMCYQGVWFTSGSPKEYWTVASEIPKEVYNIPPNSPAYNITYVTVTDDDPNDDWVINSYTSGYEGEVVDHGVAVSGTGYYYEPYVYYGDYYPIYYPYYPTYGYGSWYNPFLGRFGRGGIGYGPYGGFGYAAIYNPGNGSYARGVAAHGVYGSRTFAQAGNVRTGTYAQTRQGSNIYGNWGSTFVQRGDDWARSAHAYNRATGNGVAGVRTSNDAGVVTKKGDSGRTTVARTEGGDIYAGQNGEVYRKTDSGFQKLDNNGSWVDIKREQANVADGRPSRQAMTDAATLDQLNRDARNRADGAQRLRDLDDYRSRMGGRDAAGSFRNAGLGSGIGTSTGGGLGRGTGSGIGRGTGGGMGGGGRRR